MNSSAEKFKLLTNTLNCFILNSSKREIIYFFIYKSFRIIIFVPLKWPGCGYIHVRTMYIYALRRSEVKGSVKE